MRAVARISDRNQHPVTRLVTNAAHQEGVAVPNGLFGAVSGSDAHLVQPRPLQNNCWFNAGCDRGSNQLFTNFLRGGQHGRIVGWIEKERFIGLRRSAKSLPKRLESIPDRSDEGAFRATAGPMAPTGQF
jgi:hypothetical protein